MQTNHQPTPGYVPSWEQAAARDAAPEPETRSETRSQARDRRDFLRGAARAALAIGGLNAATLAATHGASKTLTFGDIPTLGLLKLPGLDLKADVRVLNYALALEDLESDLYEQYVMRLTTGGTNKLGTQISGLGLDTYMPDVYHIMQFTRVEEAHRDFLRGALKLDGLIPGLGIRPKRYDFGIETKSREDILAMLIDVEATGASAYLGAIPYFRTKIFLTTAAGIQGTEARHTAALQTVQNRLLMDKLIASGTPAPPAPLATMNHGIDTPLDPDTVLAKVSPFIVG